MFPNAPIFFLAVDPAGCIITLLIRNAGLASIRGPHPPVDQAQRKQNRPDYFHDAEKRNSFNRVKHPDLLEVGTSEFNRGSLEP
jgi:hypothetical protein